MADQRFKARRAGNQLRGIAATEGLIVVFEHVEGSSLTAAFREAKRMAGWRREIPEDEHGCT